MLKELLRRLKASKPQDALSDIYKPRMPRVEMVPNIEEVFNYARRAAAGEDSPSIGGMGSGITLITPGRIVIFYPCPPPGSMAESSIVQFESIVSPEFKRNIAVIAYTELKAVENDISKAIPFVGVLMGLAYIGHSVWIFEGHESALMAGCRDADVLIVDDGMLPYLLWNWRLLAASTMRSPEMYVYNRKTFSLYSAN